jgi:hypothetical protein
MGCRVGLKNFNLKSKKPKSEKNNRETRNS